MPRPPTLGNPHRRLWTDGHREYFQHRPAGGNRQLQTFPVLNDSEIARIARFGSVQHFARGSRLFTAGEVGAGMFVLLKGVVSVTQRDGLGHVVPIVRQGPGEFLAEVGQLSGRPPWSAAMPRRTSRRWCCRPRNCAPCWWPRPTSASASPAR